MARNKYSVIIGILLLLILIIFPFFKSIQNYLQIPTNLVTFQNEPVHLTAGQGNNSTHITTFNETDVSQSGEQEIIFKKGNIPIKKVDISVLKNKQIVPGGQSVGVQLNTVGVLVVGHHLVHTKDETSSPGEEADIKVGDIIVKMNGQPMEKVGDVKPIVEQAGTDQKTINVELKRGKSTLNTQLKPRQNKENVYQIGLYIKDSTTGIGTISFYDLETKKYGALGHIISDNDTKKPIELNNGKIVNSVVDSIEKGNQGFPGEKRASFSMKDEPLGTVTKNSPFGIFGKLNTHLLDDIPTNKPLDIGLAHEVKKGPAHILTVVDGNKVEQFDIEIINSIPQKYPATKGMVIKVNDEQLLKKTGGIIQGMSGSPIIQNGKLIGAVTHVFVNDPTSGYGVHIEWMLEEAGIALSYVGDQEAS